jgi:hypothetical protein
MRPQQFGDRQGAIDNATAVLLDFTTQWTARDSSSEPAWLALADVLEARGQISGHSSEGISAIDAVHRAEQLTSDPRQRLPLETRLAWLRFKQGDFQAAQILADSILITKPSPSRDEAKALVGLAALTGKVSRTAELSSLSGAFVTSDLPTPPPARILAATFFALAALGACGDTVIEVQKSLETSIASLVAENQQAQMRWDLTSRPLSMLAPCTNGMSAVSVESRGDPQLELQAAYAKRDLRRLRARLDTISQDSRSLRAGDVSLDYTYQVAWVRAASGDTAGAITQLDRSLGALASMNRLSLNEPASAAAAGRAMALRADLAAATKDPLTAQRWARSLLQLWATADAPLKPILTRMRALSQ